MIHTRRDPRDMKCLCSQQHRVLMCSRWGITGTNVVSPQDESLHHVNSGSADVGSVFLWQSESVISGAQVQNLSVSSYSSVNGISVCLSHWLFLILFRHQGESFVHFDEMNRRDSSCRSVCVCVAQCGNHNTHRHAPWRWRWYNVALKWRCRIDAHLLQWEEYVKSFQVLSVLLELLSWAKFIFTNRCWIMSWCGFLVHFFARWPVNCFHWFNRPMFSKSLVNKRIHISLSSADTSQQFGTVIVQEPNYKYIQATRWWQHDIVTSSLESPGVVKWPFVALWKQTADREETLRSHEE